MPTATTKKAAPKKKAATKSLVRYANKSLKPKDGYIAHPLYFNSPDQLMVFPRKMFEIHTGLEIAVPPNMALHTNIGIAGAIQVGSMHFGYQRELVLRCYNLTDTMLEIDPYQLVGSMFLTEIKGWR